jgi:hypothetical protein
VWQGGRDAIRDLLERRGAVYSATPPGTRRAARPQALGGASPSNSEAPPDRATGVGAAACGGDGAQLASRTALRLGVLRTRHLGRPDEPRQEAKPKGQPPQIHHRPRVELPLIHQSMCHPISNPTNSRFDHHLPPSAVQDRGILYAAITGMTPFAEVFQETRVIDRRRNAPWLVAFDLARPLELLDLTDSWPTRAGASMAINSGHGPKPVGGRNGSTRRTRPSRACGIPPPWTATVPPWRCTSGDWRPCPRGPFSTGLLRTRHFRSGLREGSAVPSWGDLVRLGGALQMSAGGEILTRPKHDLLGHRSSPVCRPDNYLSACCC